jgi:cell division protein FtsN
VGILIGMLIGAVFAAGIAWFLMKSPSPYLPSAKVSPPVRVTPPKPAVATPETSTEVGEESHEVVDNNKSRFDFYQVLTDSKGEPEMLASESDDKPVERPKTIASGAIKYLQAGSFSQKGDAEKQRAKLAILGIESDIYTVTIPNRGVWHRVRLGPYQNAAQVVQAQKFLEQNGINATPMVAQ